MTQDIPTADLLTMKKNRKHKRAKEEIIKARQKNPEHVDWKLCADTVDSLHEWVEELCIENFHLKKTLREVIDRIKKDNEITRKILKDLNLPDLGSTDIEDQ